MNMKINTIEKDLSGIFKVLGSAFRIQIINAIGFGEACVCHLEALLKKRQAYISQHLMVLRDAGVLDTRREGKYIFYRVADKTIFELIESTAGILNISAEELPNPALPRKEAHCECPKCQAEA
jgi:ArsR family transcriptional regulator